MTNELWWKHFFRGAWEEVQLPGYPEQRTSAEVAFMIDALQLRNSARILDIPCGEGRHAVELGRRGFDVTGIDFNENAIAVAKQHATEAKLDVSFVVGDMRELTVVEEYDAVICFCGSFGCFSDDDNFEFLRRVARALRPGGSFLLDGHVTESLYPKFRERDWSWIREEPPLRVLEERKMDIDEGRVDSVWTLVSPEGVDSRAVSIRIYSFHELRDMLRKAGFAAFRALETGTLEPFRLGASRLTIIAAKDG